MKNNKLVDIIIVLGILLAVGVGILTIKHYRETASKQIEATSNIDFYLLFIFAVSPACQSSFVFDVGLTTGFVEIGLSLTTMILYTINGVMSIGRIHQIWCKYLCNFYIDFGVIL